MPRIKKEIYSLMILNILINFQKKFTKIYLNEAYLIILFKKKMMNMFRHQLNFNDRDFRLANSDRFKVL